LAKRDQQKGSKAKSAAPARRLAERLVAERRELTADLPRVGELAELFPKGDVQDPEDLSVQDTQRDVALDIVDRRSSRIRLIDAALARIADGTYGTCVECGEPVSPARLEADPAVALCITCQRKAEEGMPMRMPEL
jgi:DnaK suppressor protein